MKIDRFAIDGAGALDAQLARLGTEVATEIGVSAVRQSAEALQTAWEGVAPVGVGQRSPASLRYGPAKANIKVRRQGTDNPNVIVFQVDTGNAFWMSFYEFGTVKQAARPTFRPAVDRMKDELVSIQIKALNEGIEREAGR